MEFICKLLDRPGVSQPNTRLEPPMKSLSVLTLLSLTGCAALSIPTATAFQEPLPAMNFNPQCVGFLAGVPGYSPPPEVVLENEDDEKPYGAVAPMLAPPKGNVMGVADEAPGPFTTRGGFGSKGNTGGTSGGVRKQAAEQQPSSPPPAPQMRPEMEEALLDQPAEVQGQRTQRAQSQGWGDTIFLSNDDVSSLASPQRLLYALEQNVSFSVDQIRPYELLNYFNFDVPAPPRGQDFAWSPSATVEGDQLHLAIAVQGATPPRAPVDLTLLIDRSGSMSAEGRMNYTQRALSLMTNQLKPGDRLDYVVFDSSPCTVLSDFVVGRDDPRILSAAIQQTQPRGSTDLNSGLTTAYKEAVSNASIAGRDQRVMLFTDAQMNTGTVDKEIVTQIGAHLETHDIRLTGVGVGRDFRDDVLDLLTEKGRGAYVFLGSERVVDRLFASGFDGLIHTLASDVRFSLDLPPSLRMERFYGEESSTVAADVQPVNFLAGGSQVFLQDLQLRNGRVKSSDTLTFTITWRDPSTGQPNQQRFTTTIGAALNGATRNVHKAQALMGFSDILMAKAINPHSQAHCGQPFTDFMKASANTGPDAELSYVQGLTSKLCPSPHPVMVQTFPLKLYLDSDQVISEVNLSCPSSHAQRGLDRGTQALTMEASAGQCRVTLQGSVPMTINTQLADNQHQLRCVVRAGAMDCR